MVKRGHHRQHAVVTAENCTNLAPALRSGLTAVGQLRLEELPHDFTHDLRQGVASIHLGNDLRGCGRRLSFSDLPRANKVKRCPSEKSLGRIDDKGRVMLFNHLRDVSC